LKKNEPIVPKQTSYARVLSGEIPILFDYDFNAYRAKYKDKANVEFVIPAEGTIVAPYVMGLVKSSPQPENGRKILGFVLSDKGQALWANAFPRPVRAGTIAAACPGIGMQLSLDLRPDAPSAFVMEPPALMLHQRQDAWGQAPGLLTHVSLVEDPPGQYPGPCPFF
jgi:ABC-type Fe3+ transport system substrate-binding protein